MPEPWPDYWSMPAEHEPLAPYALRAAGSRGRRHPEAPHPLRTAFQRDRDRIVHARAFRRLEYKTQVFVTGLGDHFRTRLTHTIEVAGITRTIARALGLNEDLAEAIALGHDLGHPPFGHCGERALARLLAAHGGFDHNHQALKVVDELEEKYPDFPGLNLTWEVRSGLVKHRTPGCQLDGEALPALPPLEAQAADVADDLTYYAHDLDDGLLAGLLKVEDLAGLELWRRVAAHAPPAPLAPDDERYAPFMIRNCIDLLVADVVTASRARLRAAAPASPAAAAALPEPLLGFSAAVTAACAELKRYLFERLYWSPLVLDDNNRAVAWMCELFAHFLEHPEHLGRRSRRRIALVGLHVAVGDYLAMMTDRYAIEQYRELVAARPS